MLRLILSRKTEPQPVRAHRAEPFSIGAARSVVWLLAEGLALLIFALFTVAIILDRAEIRLPYAAGLLAAKLSESLKDQSVSVKSLSLSFARNDRFAGVTAHDVALVGAAGQILMAVPTVEVKFTLLDLLQGRIRPKSVQIIGAEVFLRKAANGTFSLSLGAESAEFVPPGSNAGGLSSLVRGSEFLRDVPQLAELTAAAITNATVNYRDDRVQRSWHVVGGELALLFDPAGNQASLAGKLFQTDGKGATVNILAKQNVTSGTSRITALFDSATPFDLADQFPALDWMRLLDAPVSGQFDLDVKPDGTPLLFDGYMRIGSGVIVQENSVPLPFESAALDFRYLPDSATFEVANLAVESAATSFVSTGSLSLQFDDKRRMRSGVLQLTLQDISITSAHIFEHDLNYPDGRLAAKMALRPLALQIGEFSVFDDTTRLSLKGSVAPLAADWTYALDVEAFALDKAALLSLWPVNAGAKARAWVVQNITGGSIPRVNGAIRSGHDGPIFQLQFDYSDTQARFLKFMPQASQVSGYGSLDQESFEINIVSGTVNVDGLGPVAAAGSRIHFPHYRVKPAMASVDLVAEGGFQPIFDLLNRPPLSLLDRAGFKPALADGWAVVRSHLVFPAKRTLQLAEIYAATEADLTRVTSDQLVNGRIITAESLAFSARASELSIAGEATFDGLPASFVWTKPYGKSTSNAEADLSGTLPISMESLEQLGVALPEGSIAGQSLAQVDVRSRQGDTAEFTVTADLGPLAIAVPALGWSKPAGTAGTATVEGRMTDPIEIGTVSISSPGLVAKGRIDLAQGRLRAARFSEFAVNDWLSAALDYAPGTAKISGGQIDLRRRISGQSTSAMAVTLANTTVAVTDTITLQNATGTFESGPALVGQLQAQVNGGAAVEVTLQPATDGQRISVTGADAGAILRDAGLFRNALGGDLQLTMVQTGAPGAYRGLFEIHNIRVRDAPVLAALLSAASIIGFLEQLDGNGLSFMTVSGRFTMQDGIIELSDAKAVGASIGISLEGRYRPADKQFDMNGVISPLYAINGIFEKLPIVGRLLGGKDGEGLLGFSYLLRGSAEAPRISVNPLSILTPGALREIFVPRRAPVPSQ